MLIKDYFDIWSIKDIMYIEWKVSPLQGKQFLAKNMLFVQWLSVHLDCTS